MSKRICSVDGCERVHKARGFCGKHHMAFLTYSDPLGRSLSRPRSVSGTCSVVGCERPVRARGWCMMHYTRWYKHGDPDVVLRSGFSVGSKYVEGAPTTYSTMHVRLHYRFGPAKHRECIDCGDSALHWSYNGGCEQEQLGPDSSGRVMPYCSHFDHYSPRCYYCHRAHDLA